MKTEFRLHRTADFTALELEDRVLEALAGKRAARIHAQVAAVRGRTRVLRVFLRQFREALGRLARLGHDLVGLFPGLDEDMARAPLFRIRQLAGAPFVGFLQLGIGRLLVPGQFFRGKHEVLGAHALGHLEIGEIGIVERLQLRIVQLYARDESFRGDEGLGHLALLAQQRDEPFGNRARLERRAADRAGEAPRRQLDAQLRDVAFVRQAARPEVGRVALAGEFSAFLEFRRGEDARHHIRLGDREARALHLGEHEALRDHRLEDREAHFRRLELRRVGATAEHLAQAFLLAAHFLGEFALRDRGAVHRRDVLNAAHAARIGLQAEERERDDDQTENDLQDALVLGDKIEHQ